MSRISHQLWLGAGLLALSTAAFAGSALQNPLRVGVIGDSNTQTTGMLQFRLTNTSNHAVKLPAWQIPQGELGSRMFEVYRNGQRVEYTGAMVKHGAPLDSDFVVLRAGETKVYPVDLAAAYNLSTTGQYSIRFKTFLQDAKADDGRRITDRNGRMASMASAPISIWIDGEAVRKTQALSASIQGRTKPGGGSVCVGGTCFEGCTTTQQGQLATALSGARSYATESKGYLATGTVGPRYTTWFGLWTASRYTKANNDYIAISSALDTQTVTFNCGCTTKNTYAYVYPTQPYRIYLCGAFWSAANTGTDSRSGTIIHETSHFNVVASTDDWVYGQTGAKSLAISDPDKALDNADSHEYFAENNPHQN